MNLRLCHLKKLVISSHRCFSAKFPGHKIVITDDEATFVAWHPKPDYAYGYTKPIIQVSVDDSSVLNTQMTPELMKVFNKQTPEQARQELMNLTHTTKHRWFPRARDKRAKKTPMDREYL